MGLSPAQKDSIEALLIKKIENKLKRYTRESSSMPFLVKLMQDKEKVAAYSFIHSLATTLGMSIYEDVSKILAEPNCDECFTKYDIGGVISKDQKSTIDNIIRQLRNGERKSDIKIETKEILQANPKNGKAQKEGCIVDFYMLKNNTEYYFEIKTVKPNIDVFTKSKTKMLEWIARKRKKVCVYLAFPYNPYYPKSYDRFTLKGLLTVGEDFLIGENFWDFLGGDNSFNEILEIFDSVGKSYKQSISEKIKEVANNRLTF